MTATSERTQVATALDAALLRNEVGLAFALLDDGADPLNAAPGRRGSTLARAAALANPALVRALAVAIGERPIDPEPQREIEHALVAGLERGAPGGRAKTAQILIAAGYRLTQRTPGDHSDTRTVLETMSTARPADPAHLAAAGIDPAGPIRIDAAGDGQILIGTLAHYAARAAGPGTLPDAVRKLGVAPPPLLAVDRKSGAAAKVPYLASLALISMPARAKPWNDRKGSALEYHARNRRADVEAIVDAAGESGINTRVEGPRDHPLAGQTVLGLHTRNQRLGIASPSGAGVGTALLELGADPAIGAGGGAPTAFETICRRAEPGELTALVEHGTLTPATLAVTFAPRVGDGTEAPETALSYIAADAAADRVKGFTSQAAAKLPVLDALVAAGADALGARDGYRYGHDPAPEPGPHYAIADLAAANTGRKTIGAILGPDPGATATAHRDAVDRAICEAAGAGAPDALEAFFDLLGTERVLAARGTTRFDGWPGPDNTPGRSDTTRTVLHHACSGRAWPARMADANREALARTITLIVRHGGPELWTAQDADGHTPTGAAAAFGQSAVLWTAAAAGAPVNDPAEAPKPDRTPGRDAITIIEAVARAAKGPLPRLADLDKVRSYRSAAPGEPDHEQIAKIWGGVREAARALVESHGLDPEAATRGVRAVAGGALDDGTAATFTAQLIERGAQPAVAAAAAAEGGRPLTLRAALEGGATARDAVSGTLDEPGRIDTLAAADPTLTEGDAARDTLAALLANDTRAPAPETARRLVERNPALGDLELDGRPVRTHLETHGTPVRASTALPGIRPRAPRRGPRERERDAPEPG